MTVALGWWAHHTLQTTTLRSTSSAQLPAPTPCALTTPPMARGASGSPRRGLPRTASTSCVIAIVKYGDTPHARPTQRTAAFTALATHCTHRALIFVCYRQLLWMVSRGMPWVAKTLVTSTCAKTSPATGYASVGRGLDPVHVLTAAEAAWPNLLACRLPLLLLTPALNALSSQGRPLYKDYVGDYISYDAQHYQWILASESSSSPTSFNSYTLGFEGASYFCPSAAPIENWLHRPHLKCDAMPHIVSPLRLVSAGYAPTDRYLHCV